MKHPQFIHLLSGAGRTCPDPISYHAAACPSRGGQWRGLVSHSGVKAEVLLGATVGESANSKYIYMYIDRMGDIEAPVYGFDRISQSYLVHHYQAGARDVSLILSNTTC